MLTDTIRKRPGRHNPQQHCCSLNTAKKQHESPECGVKKNPGIYETKSNNDVKILVIDGDNCRAEELAMLLRFLGQQQVQTKSQREALDSYSSQRLSAVFLGDFGCDKDYRRIVQAIRRVRPELPIVLINDNNSHTLPLDVVQHCQLQINYPFHHNQLTQVLEKICLQENRILSGHHQINYSIKLSGNSAAINHIQDLIERVSFSEATVLITGESGTGKEVIARNLHYNSYRSKGNFIAVNCGAIGPELLESELFGHEKGAFTGALNMRKGRFELAIGGTLFLDEIGDMPLDMQVKLLRVLQEKTFERVGGNVPISADVRIIAATHRNLEQMVEEGNFREDLYYRLCVFPVQVPSLRERIEDLPALITEFLSVIQREHGTTIRLDEETFDHLACYHWPGNIRELQHLLLRLTLLYPGQTVKPQQLPRKYRPFSEQNPVQQEKNSSQAVAGQLPKLQAEGMDMKSYLNEIEVKLIRAALTESKGIIAQAAKLLGLRRTTLVEKLRRYGIKSQ